MLGLRPAAVSCVPLESAINATQAAAVLVVDGFAERVPCLGSIPGVFSCLPFPRVRGDGQSLWFAVAFFSEFLWMALAVPDSTHSS